MRVGGVADSQTRSKPLKTPQNHLESRPFRPKFHLSFSQISQKPWGGWLGKQIWERSQQPPLTAFGENAEKVLVLFANCNELVLGHSPGKIEDGDDDRNIKDSDK